MLIQPVPLPPPFRSETLCSQLARAVPRISIMSPDANGSLRCFVSGVTLSDADEGTGLRFKTKSLSLRGKRTRLLGSIQKSLIIAVIGYTVVTTGVRRRGTVVVVVACIYIDLLGQIVSFYCPIGIRLLQSGKPHPHQTQRYIEEY